jgi:hypothetical protein
MADQRCSMCGKLNPADADACRFCGARLKPVLPGGAKRPAAAPPEGGEGDADWMSDLRGDMMRNRPKTSMLPPEPPRPTASDDWLQKIDSLGEEKPPASPATTGKSGSLRGKSSPFAPKPPAPAETPRRSAPPPPAPQEASPEPPAWLSKVRAQVSADRQPASPEPEKGDEDPAWLKRLRVRRTQDELAPEPPAEPEAEPAAPGELPDWLSKIREKASPETEGGDQSLQGSPLEGIAGEAGPGGLSPWGAPAPAQRPKGTAQQPAPSAEPEVPDWMKYPSGAGGAPGAEPAPGSPDWMGDISSALKETPPTPSAAPPSPVRGTGPVGRPSTSSLLGGMDAAEPGRARGTGRGFPAKARNVSPPTQPFTEPFPPAGTPSGASPFGPNWDFPADTPTDFPFPNPAADVTIPSTSAAFHGGTEPMVSPGGDEEIPDWLADAKSAPAATTPEIEEEPVVPTPDLNELLRPDSMPEWMRKPAEAEKKEQGGGEAKAGPALPENLEQAELPRWLEAMRPIQSVAVPTEDEERVESVGPLAGLRGVLSAEPVVAMPHRPGIMAGNIDATPAQMALTDILRRLLIEPEVRASRKPVRAMLLTPVVRKVMSAVLILAILMPLFTGSLFSNSVYQPLANIQAGQLVAALPTDRTVLLAFEYDASRAPEIETGVTVMLEHLAQRGIQVVSISSQPNGTMLGDGLIRYNQQMGTAMPQLVADFGYIPGGSGGLRRLGGDLREVIPNPNLDWSAGPLSAIHTISDFSMILIFAADPQSVRDWVEQVHTSAPNTPIVAMVSAASDALIFPYTQGTQPSIRGLVTGYTGAQAYRANFLPETVPVEGVAAMRWQAYASGILALLLTLSAGIIGSLVLGFLRKDQKGAE